MHSSSDCLNKIFTHKNCMQLWMCILLLLGSGVFVGLLGVAYYAEIHNITYFILVQIGVGMFEVRP